LTTENCFYMFVCTRFDKNNLWSDKDAEMLNEATKILTMYVSQSDRETERERSLQNAVSYDKTGLYTMAKFYIQIGRLRTLAVDRNECVVLLHTDFENFLEFNIKFGTIEGDNLLKEFSQFIDGNEFPDRAITAHIGGTDIFISALRINPAEREFIKKIEDRNKKFCDIQNKKYPGANIMLKTGIYFLKPGDEGGEGINYAIAAKKAVKDFTESFCVIYDDECLKKLL
ncbi:MAG: diguanylate cyclase domain-containing protein, partial [Clostridia bacterium]